eukprot:jgi/Bigna1/143237/aug1.77_g17945
MGVFIFIVSMAMSTLGTAPYPRCPDGITCSPLSPSDLPGMVFDCASVSSTTGSVLGNVYLMHGDDGMYAKGMWAETMLQLASSGYSSLACDQRGYSPNASPDDYAAYNYDVLASDILSITNAAGFNASFGGKFHIVAHDQGARIVWHAIAKGPGRDKFLSFSSLSIPHADVFSDNVYGAAADVADQTAEQYLRQLTLPNSTTVNRNTIFSAFCGEFGFTTPESCQKTFWWYNGAVDAGAMAMAPLMPFGSSIASKVNIPFEMVKNLTQYPLDGVPQTVKVGEVAEFPVFFACGSADTCDLCTNKVVQQTAALIKSNFTSAINSCGHKLINPSKCPDASERYKVIDGIIANIVSGTTSKV